LVGAKVIPRTEAREAPACRPPASPRFAGRPKAGWPARRPAAICAKSARRGPPLRNTINTRHNQSMNQSIHQSIHPSINPSIRKCSGALCASRRALFAILGALCGASMRRPIHPSIHPAGPRAGPPSAPRRLGAARRGPPVRALNALLRSARPPPGPRAAPVPRGLVVRTIRPNPGGGFAAPGLLLFSA